MAKIIKYNLCTLVNRGTEKEPIIEEVLTPVIMKWNELNEALAAREAHNGAFTVEDNGEPEEIKEPTVEERLEELAEVVNAIKAFAEKLGANFSKGVG